MVKSNAKTFEYKDYAVIFNGQDITLKLVPLKVYNTVGSLDTKHIHNIGKHLPFFEQQSSKVSDISLIRALQTNASTKKRERLPVLQRLTLNVSNICNMTCKYCYANGGNYYTHGMLMDQNTAFNAVNYVSNNFSVIDHVNFFGGEPTLNQQIIKLVCEYFIYLHKRGILVKLPHFSLTTNGYAMGRRMYQILQTYNFDVTVSLDGPQDIHNQLRPSKNGSRTYEAIVENIKAITKMGIVPEFECTYTSEHHKSNIDLIKLMDFFYDNFRCRTLHCPIVIAESNSRWFIPLETATKLYTDAIRYSVHNLMANIPKSISVAARLLNSLTTKTPNHYYCPAGQSLITINADGNIYACFMLMHGAGFCLGNVNGENHEVGYPDSVDSLVESADKQQNSACQNCWAQPLCFGCLGEDIARQGPVIQRSIVPRQSSLCDHKRKLIEVFLLSVAEVYLQEHRKQTEKHESVIVKEIKYRDREAPRSY